MTKYSDSGVDISRGEEAVERIKKHVASTYTPRVLRGVGAFAGSMDASDITSIVDPVILASIDGVGTKSLIASQANSWGGIGYDIVHHSANDLVCQGASPLLFLDYIASSKLDPAIIETIVKGMSDACHSLGCVLIGGETAEMPTVYSDNAYDIVGAIIGTVSRHQMITGEHIASGDALIAIPSNGLHTNGYSLARHALLHTAKLDLTAHRDDLGENLAEALLKPHTLYAPLILDLHKEIVLKGVAHITGGGIPGNLPRILPDGIGAVIERDTIKTPPIFSLIQNAGNIDTDEMYRACNMGVGMILVVEDGDANAVLKKATGSYRIGKVIAGEGVSMR